MKKKLQYGILISAVTLAVILYCYVYQNHRNISQEKAAYSMSVPELEKEFTTNDSLALAKFQDQTIRITATITALDHQNNLMVLDHKLLAIFTDSISKNIKINQKVTVKGRFLGYDELVDEFKMDQCSFAD